MPGTSSPRRIAWAVLVTLCFAFPADARSDARPATHPVTEQAVEPQAAGAPTRAKILVLLAQVAFDPAGGLTDLRIETPLPEALSGLVQDAVRGWRFLPPPRGTAHVARARMRLVLSAVDAPEDVRILVDGVRFSPVEGDELATRDPEPVTMSGHTLSPRPRFPRGVKVNAQVLLAAHVALDGRFQRVEPLQTVLFDVGGGEAILRREIEAFERAAISVVRLWRANVVVNDPAADTSRLTVLVPIAFSLPGFDEDAPGKWRTVIRSPLRPIPWKAPPPGEAAAGVADVGTKGMVQDGWSVRLATDVVGSRIH
jgi:hypothetical protein